MSDILPESSPSLRDHELLWWTIGAAVLVGYVIPKLMARFVVLGPSTGTSEKAPHLQATRKSRLLQEKFGSLLDNNNDHYDLQLKEEEESEMNEETTTDDRAKKAEGASTTKEKTTKQKKKPCSSNAISKNESTPSRPIAFQNTNDHHPGLNAFRYWWDVQTSLYRIYTLTTRADTTGQPSDNPPPYNPSSRRGKTPVDLRVTNETNDDDDIVVYWINYTGGYELKGTIPPGHTWTQSTWIDHPWVFCQKSDNDTDAPIVHYIPYKIIPNVVPEAPTVDLNDLTTTTIINENDMNDTTLTPKKKRLIGIHRFSIVKLPMNNRPNNNHSHDDADADNDDPRRMYTHWIRDDILPLGYDITTEQQALELSLLHCIRTGYYHWPILLQYWEMIQQHPDQSRYRQIRIANRTFHDAIWNTAARGIFFSTGWIEHGAYLELGVASRPFPRPNDLSRIIATIQRWKQRAEDETSTLHAEQPEGADGYGRAGFQ